MRLRLRICRDVCGAWSVHGLASPPAVNLPSLSASLDYARRECAAAAATIELLIDGFYAVVHQEEGWPHPPIAVDAGTHRPAARAPSPANYKGAASVARSRSSWFIERRDAAMRLIASLASGFVSMKRSKSVFLSTSSRQ
jgi:hypothetical protein